MRDPAFWQAQDPYARAAAPLTRALLTPLAAIYAWAGARRIRNTTPVDPDIPVICIGNLTVGGAGKTPLTTFIRERLTASTGKRIATLSRGYGGVLKDTTRVRADHHTAREVGDEPLMMAASGESWIGRDRAAAALAMAQDGVDLILMDDGFQNPTLKKTLSILVVDAGNPFGNGYVFPKGPLREPITAGLARADLVVMMGEGETPASITRWDGPVIRAHTQPRAPAQPGRYVAFAGIGRPEKFFDSLSAQPNVELSEAVPFADHHPFTPADMAFLHKLADEREARLITTEKDYVRLNTDQRDGVLAFPITVALTSDDLARLDVALQTAI